MAPQALTTIATTSTATPSQTFSVVLARDDDNTGLTQADIGGILGGVVAFVTIVLVTLACIIHKKKHRRNNPSNATGHLYYDQTTTNESDESDTLSSTEVSASTRQGRSSRISRSRHSGQGRSRRLTPEEQATLAANQAAMAAAAAREQARARMLAQAKTRRFTAADIKIADNYVLNPPLPRFPPTVRPAI